MRRHKEDDVTQVFKYYECIEALKTNERFDLVSLDHDLGDFQTADIDSSAIYGSADKKEFTGYDVAWYIARQLEDDKIPPRVIIHSVNPVGAKRMLDVFKSAHISAFMIPFGAEEEKEKEEKEKEEKVFGKLEINWDEFNPSDWTCEEEKARTLFSVSMIFTFLKKQWEESMPEGKDSSTMSLVYFVLSEGNDMYNNGELTIEQLGYLTNTAIGW